MALKSILIVLGNAGVSADRSESRSQMTYEGGLVLAGTVAPVPLSTLRDSTTKFAQITTKSNIELSMRRVLFGIEDSSGGVWMPAIWRKL